MGRKNTSENYISSNKGTRAMNFHGKRRSSVKLSIQNTFQTFSCKRMAQIKPGNTLFPACVNCYSVKHGILYSVCLYNTLNWALFFLVLCPYNKILFQEG